MVERLDQFVTRLVGFPRMIRIIIVAFFALMIVLAVFPLVDSIYLDYFFSPDTVVVPAIVTVAIGSLAYIFGWYVYIGTVGTIPPAKNRVLWYFVLGSVATIIVVGLFVYGVIDLNIPVESV